MAAGPLHPIIRQLRNMVRAEGGSGLTDAELLESFVTLRDEAAFEVLLWRHGPMVLGVCRRLLRQEADVEDAFQATFLALSRKAGSIRWREAVGGWLHKVAHRVALDARTLSARSAAREKLVPVLPAVESGQDVPHQAAGREMHSLL